MKSVAIMSTGVISDASAVQLAAKLPGPLPLNITEAKNDYVAPPLLNNTDLKNGYVGPCAFKSFKSIIIQGGKISQGKVWDCNQKCVQKDGDKCVAIEKSDTFDCATYCAPVRAEACAHLWRRDISLAVCVQNPQGKCKLQADLPKDLTFQDKTKVHNLEDICGASTAIESVGKKHDVGDMTRMDVLNSGMCMSRCDENRIKEEVKGQLIDANSSVESMKTYIDKCEKTCTSLPTSPVA